MAFNLTSWSRTGRDFGRGAPPPPGSVEYAASGDPIEVMGFNVPKVYKISYTELDAAKNWVEAVDRSVKQSRSEHVDRVLSAADERIWNEFLDKWKPFYGDMSLPGHFNAMLSSNKKAFDDLLNECRKLYVQFAAKGMSLIPVPYAGELLQILRTTPKKLTASEMQSRLIAGARCGEQMLNTNMTWVDWLTSRDHNGLRDAISDARRTADVYGRSAASNKKYSAGDPVYDDFVRRLAKVWVEAAGLAGIRATQESAKAGLASDLDPGGVSTSVLLYLALAGGAYAGLSWLLSPKKQVRVAVPDYYQGV